MVLKPNGKLSSDKRPSNWISYYIVLMDMYALTKKSNL